MFSYGLAILLFLLIITPASVDTFIISLSILWAGNMISNAIKDSKK